MHQLRVALAQVGAVVGDLDGNSARISEALDEAERAGADLAVLPRARHLRLPAGGPAAQAGVRAGQPGGGRQGGRPHRPRASRVIGFPDAGHDLYNAAAVCAGGRVVGVYRKRLLPNYAVFDEQRYFTASTHPLRLFRIGGVRVGVTICEDAWSPSGPVGQLGAGGAELVVNLSASPYYAGRLLERERMLATRAEDASCGLVYVNLVGGQDELLFDGASLVFDADGEVVSRLPQFTETVEVIDLAIRPAFRKRLLDPRGRVPTDELPVIDVSPAVADRDPADVRRPALAEPLPLLDELYSALVARDARLRGEERVHRRRHRAVGRHRLLAGGDDRHRRSRPPTTSTACSCRRGSRRTTR